MINEAAHEPIHFGSKPGELASALTRLVRKPSAFFSLLPEDLRWSAPLAFLVAMSLVSATIRAIFLSGDRALLFGVFLANALGMACLTAIVLYVITVSIRGVWSEFSRFFAVTAYASGAALLISWIPDVALWGELWKWVLVGSGLVRACGLSRFQALWVIGLSIALMTVGFWGIASLFG